ncbi:MAG: hypothetical protein V4469_02360 [Patescibacteria group bacterium]
MKLILGNIKEDWHADVFWQRSFIEDDNGSILCKIIVCADIVFLSRLFKKQTKDIKVDEVLKKWFEEKTNLKYVKFQTSENQDNFETLFDFYPQTNGMLQFAYSIK